MKWSVECFPTLASLTIHVRKLLPIIGRPKTEGGKSRQIAPFNAETHQKVLAKMVARCNFASVVVFGPQVCDQIFSTKITKSILELHQLDKHIVFWIESRCSLR